MKSFKVEYDKYKARQRKNKQEKKQRKENLEKFLDDAKKRKAKKKAEDLKKFNEDARKSVAKHEAKKKAEDLKKFKDDAKKRKSEHEAKKKAEDIGQFKENAKERRAKSDRNITGKKRIQNFKKKKVQFGPIFVCSSCHQKLFQNQVQELTDKLKEEIDPYKHFLRNFCVNKSKILRFFSNFYRQKIFRSHFVYILALLAYLHI